MTLIDRKAYFIDNDINITCPDTEEQPQVQ